MSIWEPVEELPEKNSNSSTNVNSEQARLGLGQAMTQPRTWGRLDIGTDQVNRLSQYANRINKGDIGGHLFEASVRNNELFVRYLGGADGE